MEETRRLLGKYDIYDKEQLLDHTEILLKEEVPKAITALHKLKDK